MTRETITYQTRGGRWRARCTGTTEDGRTVVVYSAAWSEESDAASAAVMRWHAIAAMRAPEVRP